MVPLTGGSHSRWSFGCRLLFCCWAASSSTAHPTRRLLRTESKGNIFEKLQAQRLPCFFLECLCDPQFDNSVNRVEWQGWVLLSEKLELAPIVLHHLIASCEDLSVCNIYLFFSFIFGPHHVAACGILVPWPGIRLVHPAVEVWSPNHWTTRKTPVISTFCVGAIPGRVGTSQIITWIFTLVLKAGGMVSFA